jgi:acetaldehyde dehydrogenase
MRDAMFVLSNAVDQALVEASIVEMAAAAQA